MVHVQHTAALGVHIAQQPLCHQLAVAARVAQGRVVLRQVGGGLGRVGLQTPMTEGIDMLAQDALTQAPRAAVHQEQQTLRVDAQRGQGLGRVHGVHLLELGEVVAAADGAQRGLVATGLNPSVRHGLVSGLLIVHRAVDVAHALLQLVQPDRARLQVGLPQRHAAADVVAHERGVETLRREKRSADRVTAAGVQIGHASDPLHALQL